MNRSPESAVTRQYYVDNLRNIAVLLLIAFHTARLFDEEAWHIKDAAAYRAADMIVGFFNPWHMPLLFLLAGMSAVLSMRTRGLGTFVGERFSRLFVPFVTGVILTVLPQVYLERISPYVPNRNSPIDFEGSFFDFIPEFFSFVPYPEGDFSWHHLWFIVYLFLYSILLSPLLLWMARSPGLARLGDRLARSIAPLLLFVPVLLLELGLRGAYPSTHALIDDWANHANFVVMIILGGLIAASPALAESTARLRRAALSVAIVLMIAWLTRNDWAPEFPGLPVREIVWTIRAAAEWFSILALLGYSRTYIDREIRYLTPFTRYALPFYIFHQFVIIWLGWLTFGWSGMPLAKFIAIAAAALFISYGLARLFDLTSVTRFLIGLKAGRRPMSPSEAPRAA